MVGHQVVNREFLIVPLPSRWWFIGHLIQFGASPMEHHRRPLVIIGEWIPEEEEDKKLVKCSCSNSGPFFKCMDTDAQWNFISSSFN